MNENEVKTEALQPEEAAVQPNADEVKPAEVQETAPAADSAVNTQSDAYFEAMRRLEEEKKAAKKKKKKKRLLIVLAVIAAIILFTVIKNAVSNSITFSNQVDRVSALITAEEYNYEEYKSAADSIGANQMASDSKKAKTYFKLGKEAVEIKNLNCYEDLFDRSIAKDEKYKPKVVEYIGNAIAAAETNEELLDYAAYYLSLGETLDEASVAKIQENLIESIGVGKLAEYNEKLKICEALGLAADDEVNAKIYAVAMEAYKAENYSKAYNWFNIYKGKEDIKAAKQESAYEYVIEVLFGLSINLDIEDEYDWARELLSTDEMKNYKQSEGLRLYCNLAEAALKSYRNSQNENAQDDYIKSKLIFPNSYNFIGKSITSDFYMKKDGEDKAKICYDCTIAYTAMNKYGYTVTDTYDLTNSNSFSLDGSDYLLAVKIFNNFSNENMIKYARTGEFTNTKVTFEY